MLGKFIARDFIAIAGKMRRSPASNENTVTNHPIKYERYQTNERTNHTRGSAEPVSFTWL